MQKPSISTAIPKQRYKYGGYTVVVLEEIQSSDEIQYEYLLAAIKDGHNEPEIYITCEKAAPSLVKNGSHIVRVFADQLPGANTGQVIDQSNAWSRKDKFIEYALSGFQQMLQLQDEQVIPLG